MQISAQLSHIAQVLGRAVSATAAALHSMRDAKTDLVTVAVWAIAERAGCNEVQARRDLHALAGEGIIEIDENQEPDAMQRANTYRWVGVGTYERKSQKAMRLERRAIARANRLHHNEHKRAQRKETLEVYVSRRIHKGIERGIAAYWTRQGDVFAPYNQDRALQVSDSFKGKSTSRMTLKEVRLWMEEERRRR